MRLRLLLVILLVVALVGVYVYSNKSKVNIVEQVPEQTTETVGTIASASPDPVEKPINEAQDVPASPDNKKLPKFIEHRVPFTSQAPFAEWDDPRQQDGCEEASVLMAASWVHGQSLNAITARLALEKLFSWEEKTFGFSTDLDAEYTARVLKEYYKISGVAVSYDVTVNRIRTALADGKVVIVPTDGQALGNPYFSGDGPERHMLVIIGYDDTKGEFIVNDPGTKRGAGYRYGYAILLDSVREYPAGDHQPMINPRRALITVAQ